jgi:hypothetical protein
VWCGADNAGLDSTRTSFSRPRSAQQWTGPLPAGDALGSRAGLQQVAPCTKLSAPLTLALLRTTLAYHYSNTCLAQCYTHTVVSTYSY